MTFRDQVLRSGQWLFRWRSYLPLVGLAIVLGHLPFARPTDGVHHHLAWEALCLAIAGFGFAIRLFVAGHVPRDTSGRNTLGQQAAELNTTGLYSVMRHPLYVGNFFMWLGVLLFKPTWWLVIGVVVAYWIYYPIIMFTEEEWLRAKFGGAYRDWAARTPAIIPNLRLWRPHALPFSLRTAMRREYSGLLAIVAVFTALEVGSNWVATGRPCIDRFWGVLVGLCLAAYLFLRFAKRHTRLLDVTGR